MRIMQNENKFGQILPLSSPDLSQLTPLQPDGWPDITSAFKQYLNLPFCYPVKIMIRDQMAGVGCAILFKTSAWLAHIIVAENFRRQGIGAAMVGHLLKLVESHNIPTSLLIATEMGKPVYEQAGFREVTDYCFFKRIYLWEETHKPDEVIAVSSSYHENILRLDQEITGEDRSGLLKPYLHEGFMIAHDNQLTGFYLPEPEEGPIIAQTPEAGVALMKIKYASRDKAVLPADNVAGINFLLDHGFEPASSSGKRMIRGKEIAWKPHNIFSRIGGNFG